MQPNFSINGNIIDVLKRRIIPGKIEIKNGKIYDVQEVDKPYNQYILPGLIDSHVHIESSMLTPLHFAQLALKKGFIASVSDPHEIANVCGIKGIEYLIHNAKAAPYRFFFGAPSCVPATPFDSSGYSISPDDIRYLFSNYENFVCLSEIMNFPGVIHDDLDLIKKIRIAKEFGKKIDGHAPGLSGDDLVKYINAGISADHECTTIEEAEEKIRSGMLIQIREGSAAKNFDVLAPLIDKYPDNIMICSDDCHPDELEAGYLLTVLKKGLKRGINLFNLLKAYTFNPVRHYNLPIGLLNVDDSADFIVIDDLENWNVKKVYLRGKQVYDSKRELKYHFDSETVNTFNASFIKADDIKISADSGSIRVIQAYDNSLYTNSISVEPKIENGLIVPDIDKDILKIVVLNRYRNQKPAVGFIKGFQLKKGAMASSIAHDSHNLIAVGTNDDDILKALNHLIELHGGIVVVNGNEVMDLRLEIGGLMTAANPHAVILKYKQLQQVAREYGSAFSAPFMTLSFMSLLVIPELKISDMGLFDVNSFNFTSLFH